MNDIFGHDPDTKGTDVFKKIYDIVIWIHITHPRHTCNHGFTFNTVGTRKMGFTKLNNLIKLRDI